MRVRHKVCATANVKIVISNFYIFCSPSEKNADKEKQDLGNYQSAEEKALAESLIEIFGRPVSGKCFIYLTPSDYSASIHNCQQNF